MKKVKKVPLATMLKNMERFDDEADGIYTQLKSVIENAKPPEKAPRKEHEAFFDKVLELMSKMRECRLDAQKCAVDAAPFVHPKLASVAHTISSAVEKRKAESEMSEEESADYFNRLRLRPTQVNPLTVVIDNETGDVVHEDAE